MLNVVKLGGAAVANGIDGTARRIAALPGRSVVVHGGGAEISRWQDRLDLPVTWHEGLRVTSRSSMKVAAMVLSGWMNKRVVQAFQDAGVPAAGVSGEDGALLRAERAQGGDLGEVGTVVEVRPGVVRSLLDGGFVPVVSPVSRGPDGDPLNVNADEAALHLAAALGADRIYLVSDVPGVRADGAVVDAMTPDAARRLVADGTAQGGMAVKLGHALVAAEAGVDVAIGGPDLLDDFGAGTTVLAGPPPSEIAP